MRKYKVKAGDNLTKIAKMFQVTIEAIKKANNLKSDVIQPNQILTIPTTIKTLIPKKFEFKGITKVYQKQEIDELRVASKPLFDPIFKSLKIKSNCCSGICRKPWDDLVKHDPRKIAIIQESLRKKSEKHTIKGTSRALIMARSMQGKWKILSIYDAYGKQLNMDYYSVKITKLPIVNKQQWVPNQLFEYVRKNLGSFLDGNISSFYAYDNDEKLTWYSTNPITAVMKFHVILPKTYGKGFDDAAVMCTSFVPNQYWIFSPVETSDDHKHPVSGNRQFGLRKVGNAYEFYIRGADRLTQYLDEAVGETEAFAGADKLWSGFQKKLIAFIEQHEGEAEVDDSKYVSKRCKWETK